MQLTKDVGTQAKAAEDKVLEVMEELVRSRPYFARVWPHGGAKDEVWACNSLCDLRVPPRVGVTGTMRPCKPDSKTALLQSASAQECNKCLSAEQTTIHVRLTDGVCAEEECASRVAWGRAQAQEG